MLEINVNKSFTNRQLIILLQHPLNKNLSNSRACKMGR